MNETAMGNNHGHFEVRLIWSAVPQIPPAANKVVINQPAGGNNMLSETSLW